MLLKELYVVQVVILLLGLKQIYWRCFCSGSGRFGQRPRAGSGRLVVVMRLTNFQSIPPIGSGLLGLVVRFSNFPSIPTWLRLRLIPILLYVPPFTVIPSVCIRLRPVLVVVHPSFGLVTFGWTRRSIRWISVVRSHGLITLQRFHAFQDGCGAAVSESLRSEKRNFPVCSMRCVISAVSGKQAGIIAMSWLLRDVVLIQMCLPLLFFFACSSTPSTMVHASHEVSADEPMPEKKKVNKVQANESIRSTPIPPVGEFPRLCAQLASACCGYPASPHWGW